MTDRKICGKKCIFKSRINDKGSTLVMVIVVIAFLSILATTLLYLSNMNYVMKKTDKDVKQSFYDTETAMEEIRAGLTEIASEAAKTAYVNNMIRYSVDDPYTRYASFQEEYFDALQDLWTTKTGGDAVGFLNSLIESKFDSASTEIVLSPYTHSDGTVVAGGTLDIEELDSGFVYLRNVRISYTSTDNPAGQAYTARIETDFLFTVPDMNWSINESYTSIVADAKDSKDARREYDIGEYVNYANWKKQ